MLHCTDENQVNGGLGLKLNNAHPNIVNCQVKWTMHMNWQFREGMITKRGSGADVGESVV